MSPTRVGTASEPISAAMCNDHAHDVSRPESSCVDVPHKKRGRPRLRDEAEFRVEQVEQVEPPQSAMPRPAPSRITGGERAYGTTRHGRTDSLRTLRSHASEMSIVPSLTQGTVTTTIPTAAPQSGPHYPSHPVIPTAFLDLDLAIMKTNIAFQQLFTTFQNLILELGRREAASKSNAWLAMDW
ncbi:hypothetical protein M8818_004101 [Zalaria obscura]|uniref:Uncharacterized protein n=1 Tax=Zalaria obscura TaxID=2024903 RepID=A0ACC3SEP8_9PEZI